MACRAPCKINTHSRRSPSPSTPLLESSSNTPSKLIPPTLEIGLPESSSHTGSIEVTQPIQQEISYSGITQEIPQEITDFEIT
jgi:hypothetical protein